MHVHCERRGEVEVFYQQPYLFAGFGDEAVSAFPSVEAASTENSRPCEGCGEVSPGVDLWAENSETGEELWLCDACGDW